MEADDAAQMAAFLVLLRTKGETAEEIAGLAKAMLSKAVRVPSDGNGRQAHALFISWMPANPSLPLPWCAVLDIVGTGGDGIGSVNISTGASVIAAAAGAKVAKHGSRSVSSLCGSADVLEVRA